MSSEFNRMVPWQTGPRTWLPPPAVTEHTGKPLSPDYNFFAFPPDEIGEIRSAYTNLKRGEKLTTRFAQLRAMAVAAAFGVAVAVGLELAAHVLTSLAEETHLPRAIWAMVPGALLAGLLWRLTRATGTCNFVGRAGCAELEGAVGGEKILRQRVLRFSDAQSLAFSVTRHFQRTEYSYTEFAFRWFPPVGEKACFEITGSHAANLETPPTGNYYNYGRAAEAAWCEYLAPHMDAELAQNGYIRFPMDPKRWVLVGRGFLEIEEADGARYRADAADIGPVKMQSGRLYLSCKEDRSDFFGKLGSSGSLDFDLSSVHNSRLFLLTFEKLLGLKVV